MANTNSPFGFKPIKNLDGSSWNGKVVPFLIPSSDSVDMFIGDPVDLAGSSNDATVNGFKAGTLPTIIKSTVGATNYIMGYIVDIYKPESITDALTTRYRQADVDTVVYVALGNNLILEGQADEDIVYGDIGSNCAYAAGSGGSTVTGNSSAQIDSSSVATDVTEQLHLLRLVNKENNALGDYAVCEVTTNKLRIHPFTVGV